MRVGVRSLISKTFSGKRGSAAERAERAYANKDYADAAVLFRELAEQGSPEAQLRLAQMYERGEGVLQSFVDAVRWYGEAARRGVVAAQARLGEILLTGLAAPRTASASALARMESQGSQESLLGRMFPQGLAVRQDTAQAAQWNRAAAEAGDAPAQARFGYQCAAGLGVERDLALAL